MSGIVAAARGECWLGVGRRRTRSDASATLGVRRWARQMASFAAAARLLARARRRTDSVIEVAAWRWMAIEWDRGCCLGRQLAQRRPTPRSVGRECDARCPTFGAPEGRAPRWLLGCSLAHGVAPTLRLRWRRGAGWRLSGIAAAARSDGRLGASRRCVWSGASALLGAQRSARKTCVLCGDCSVARSLMAPRRLMTKPSDGGVARGVNPRQVRSRLLLAATAGSVPADAALGRARVRCLVPDVQRAR